VLAVVRAVVRSGDACADTGCVCAAQAYLLNA
jgi:hypothetical protein